MTLNEHLDRVDLQDHRYCELDGMVRYILHTAPDTFSCEDERDEWICDQLAGLNAWDRDYVRDELEQWTEKRILE